MENSMMTRINVISFAKAEETIGKDKLMKLIRRGIVKVVRRSNLYSQAYIESDSLPRQFRQAFSAAKKEQRHATVSSNVRATLVIERAAQKKIIDALTSIKTRRYYSDQRKSEQKLDKAMEQINPALFQCPHDHTLPCVQQFLLESDSLMAHYIADMKELADICSNFALTPNRILERFGSSKQCVSKGFRKPLFGLRV